MCSHRLKHNSKKSLSKSIHEERQRMLRVCMNPGHIFRFTSFADDFLYRVLADEITSNHY